MRKIIPLIFLLGYCYFPIAQITVPIVKANFGVEADLSSNYFNNAPQPAVDDWFSNGYPGTGKAVIDTNGAAAIVAAYTSNPASKKLSFAKPMAFPGYTIVNNRLLLDATYYRDYHGTDSTVYASGSNKNGMNPGVWSTPVAQSIPDKNDILEAMVHVRRAGPNVTDSLWLFAGISLENVSGNRFFDFELYQTDIAYNKSTGTFTGYGPDAGHTSWQFNATGSIKRPGDVIFTAEFSSSSLTLVEARIWIHKSMLSITPATFNWGGQFDGDGTGATYGYANILPKSAGNFYTGLQTSVPSTWAGPFKVVRDNETVLNNYIPGQFMEFSVNLSKLGIEPANYSGNACGSAFIRVLVKTRSSTSFTSELKDFIAPFKFFNYPDVEAFSYLTYYCGVMPQINISVINPNPSSIYTWNTPNGNIVGSNIGPVITIDAPGTYYVQQQLNVACPAQSIDSVTILFSAICTVLDINITQLTATAINDYNVLKWQASNNQDAFKYEIEYSTNNNTFLPLGYLNAGNVGGDVNFEFRHLSGMISSDVIFYRIKVTGKNGASKYSNIIALRKSNTGKKEALVFPNPTKGLLWLSYLSAKKELADVMIFDNYGKLVATAQYALNTGENLVKLPELSGKSQGVYLVKIKTSNGFITQRILLLK
jgi:Secretion system C-terminal sorting domain